MANLTCEPWAAVAGGGCLVILSCVCWSSSLSSLVTFFANRTGTLAASASRVDPVNVLFFLQVDCVILEHMLCCVVGELVKLVMWQFCQAEFVMFGASTPISLFQQYRKVVQRNTEGERI